MGRPYSLLQRRGVVALASVLVIALAWSSTPRSPASAARPGIPESISVNMIHGHTGGVVRQGGRLRAKQVVTTPDSCVSPITPATPTPTRTPTETPTPTMTPLPTATPTSTPAVSPTPVSTQVPLPTTCLVSASPVDAFNALGTPHTAFFLCGNAASSLPGSPSAHSPTAGCFDVTGSVTDVTTGSATSITGGSCGTATVSAGTQVNCGGVANPICPAGFAPSGTAGACAPCPGGATVGGGQCHYNPAHFGGTCPPGTTPVFNSAHVLFDCVGPFLSPSVPTAANEVAVTINPGAPHDYLITFTGYVNTTADGTCPPGTALVSSVDLTLEPSGAGATSGPACRFSVRVEKKYLEVTSLQIIPVSSCGGAAPSEQAAALGSTGCLIQVRAVGTVILKTGVDCTQEPSGTLTPVATAPPGQVGVEPPQEDGIDEYQEDGATEAAEGVAEGPDLKPGPGLAYDCSDNTLRLIRGVPHLTISLTADNGLFPDQTACVPPSQQPVLATATATGTPATPTLTPIPPTPTPTIPPTPGTAPTPVPVINGSITPKFCLHQGTTTKLVVTDENGIAPVVPAEIETVAMPDANLTGDPENCTYSPYVRRNFGMFGVSICGRILVDDAGYPNSPMSTVFNYPPEVNPPPIEVCHPVEAYTNINGRAVCTNIDVFGAFNGSDLVSVDVLFDLVGDLVGNACSTRTFFVRNGPPPDAPLPLVTYCPPHNLGIAVIANGFGPLSVTASYSSTLNTQPAVSSGAVQLGNFIMGTPVPTVTVGPTVTATPVPATNTPVPTPTDTPTPTRTATPTSTPTNTPTSTATPTPTPVPPLRFSVDAARVKAAKPPSSCATAALDVVKPGQSVCLLLYFTIRSVPRIVKSTRTYEITHGRTTVFRVSFSGTVSPGGTGRFVRFTYYVPPTNLPFGVYVYTGTLKLDGRSQSRRWKFALVRSTVVNRYQQDTRGA